jgi:hypothetical protein
VTARRPAALRHLHVKLIDEQKGHADLNVVKRLLRGLFHFATDNQADETVPGLGPRYIDLRRLDRAAEFGHGRRNALQQGGAGNRQLRSLTLSSLRKSSMNHACGSFVAIVTNTSALCSDLSITAMVLSQPTLQQNLPEPEVACIF